ncbi:MAG: hypothetical protein Pars2KO_33030 [Parasphingorhabdus sp.]
MLTGKRAERTRRSMLDAGINLLVDRPIDAIPVDDVIAKAGVAKGSFFNHFVDKQGFSKAIYEEIRGRLEERIGAANHDVDNPLLRLSGGMRIAVEFALAERKSCIAMLRSAGGSTSESHPLNLGIQADLKACIDAKLVDPETGKIGILYWLGLCQALMTDVIQRRLSVQVASKQLHQMLLLGLTGLGVDAELVHDAAASQSESLKHVQNNNIS